MAAFNFEGFRLSAQQKRLWLLLQQKQEHYAQALFSLEGKFDRVLLEKAVQYVFSKHESLRTSFCRVPDMKFPLQVIAERPLTHWIEEDISACLADEQALRLAEIRQRELGFLSSNLERISWRIVLVKRSPLQHTVLLTLSALCVDTISLGNIYHEIAQHYQIMRQNAESQKEKVVQYVHYVEWQYEIQSEESEERLLATTYWEQLLARRDEGPSFLFKQLKNRQGGTPPKSLVHRLPDQLREYLEVFAQQHTVPISQVVLACWLVVLQRLSASDSVRIECFCDGRTDEAISPSIGLFARFLPVEIHIAQISFMELLRLVSLAMQQASLWQDYSFAVQQQEADSGGMYLYEYGVKPSEHTLPDLTFSVEDLFVSMEPIKLKLSCYQSVSEILIEWIYDSHVFAATDIKRIAGYFETLIRSACDTPQTSIEALHLQSQQDRDHLIRTLNAHYDSSLGDHPTCVHILFEIQAARTPHQPALLYKDREITYGELNMRANQLARHLRTLQVGPEVRVGVYAERSLEMVVGLLAVLKAGGVYVPLDPAYPLERLEIILQDADMHVLLLHTQRDATTFALNRRKVLLDRDGPLIEQQERANLNIAMQPENLAYIVYTSGTTGGTKGVSVPHASLCTYIYALQRQIQVNASDIYAHTASFAFSSSMRQLFLPLLHGATVFIASTEQRKDPFALFRAFQNHQVTIWDVVPTFWRSALQALTPEQIAGNTLRLILSASEALKADIVHHWNLAYQERRPPDMINMYGQTETTGIVSLHSFPKAEESATPVIPLGKPIACVQFYILDQSLQPVPIDTPGEVYIGGMSLARGYFQQPALTAERFLPDMLGDVAGARLYKTGDIAQYTADGIVTFVGREDYQVKLRGIRIAPSEIEAVLTLHADVQDVVVMGHEEHADEMQLVAYIVPRKGKELSTSDLQAFLKSHLPGFMVPAAFILLDAFPLTSTGKIDRQAFPTVSSSRPKLTSIYAAPQTACEKKLVQLWEQVLGITPIGRDDDFFELGGHSLQAVRLTSAIQQTFQIDFSLTHFLSTSSVAGLANVISEQLAQQKSGMDVNLLVADLEQLSEEELQEILQEVESATLLQKKDFYE